jgi:hypothetical protein
LETPHGYAGTSQLGSSTPAAASQAGEAEAPGPTAAAISGLELGTFACLERDFEGGLQIAAEVGVPPWLTTAPLDEGVEVINALLRGPAPHPKTLVLP